MTIILSLNDLFLICNWTKHSSPQMNVPLPDPEIVLWHVVNFGLFFKLMKSCCDITLIDAPVPYSATIFVLFTLILYYIALSEFTSSMVMSLMIFSSQSESESVSLSCMAPMSCSACSIEYVDFF